MPALVSPPPPSAAMQRPARRRLRIKTRAAGRRGALRGYVVAFAVLPSAAFAQAAGVNYVDRTAELRQPHTASVQAKAFRTDTVEIELGPISLGVLEYKVTMAAGDALVYSWSSPIDVHVELHGHTDPAVDPVMDVVFYDIRDGRQSRGSVIAPMAGMHGWYFQNPSFETFKVTLTIAGFYELGPGLRTPSAPPAAD